MSNNPSAITKSIAFRLNNEVYAILKRRADKNGKLVSQMVKERIVYDTLRKHRGQ